MTIGRDKNIVQSGRAAKRAVKMSQCESRRRHRKQLGCFVLPRLLVVPTFCQSKTEKAHYDSWLERVRVRWHINQASQNILATMDIVVAVFGTLAAAHRLWTLMREIRTVLYYTRCCTIIIALQQNLNWKRREEERKRIWERIAVFARSEWIIA